MKLFPRFIFSGLLLLSPFHFSQSTTVAYWNFDEDNGVQFPSNPASDSLVLQAEKPLKFPRSSDDIPNAPTGNKYSADFSTGAEGLMVASQPCLDFGKNAVFTIEFWFKPRQYVTKNVEDARQNYSTLIMKRGSEDDSILPLPGYQIMLQQQGLIHVRLDAGRKNETLTSKSKVPLDVWTHVAVIRDAQGTISLYINGELESSSSRSKFTASIENPGPLVIGYHAQVKTNHYRFDGLIDEIRISDTALEPSQFLLNRIP